MSTVSLHPRLRSLRRRTLAVLTASALAVSGGVLTAAPAAAADPLVGTCLITSSDQISVGLKGTVVNTLGLPVFVKVFDSKTGVLLGTQIAVSLGGGGLLNLDPITITIPGGGSTPGAVNFQVVNTLGTILGSVLGDTPCDSTRPIDGITGAYHALNPSRILDTRTTAKIPARGLITRRILGQGGVPAAGVEAVNLNLTATGGGAAGNITVYPASSARPNTSSLNFVQGQDVANTVFAQIGSQGNVNFYNNSAQPVNLIADVAGYFESGSPLKLFPGAYQPLTSSRILDTRQPGGRGKFTPLAIRTVQISAPGGIPANVSAAVLNLTVTNPTARGHITAYPTGTTLPYASNVNFVAGQTNADLVVVPLSSDGKINLHSGSVAGTVDVIVDVVGYFKAGLVPVRTAGLQANVTKPTRLFDSRNAIPVPTVKVPARGTVAVQITGRAGTPSGRAGVPSDFVRAVFVTVTTTEEVAPGSITEFPGGTRPNTSILNFVPTRDVANLVLASVGADGKIRLYNGSSAPTHLVVDVSGYITGATVSVG